MSATQLEREWRYLKERAAAARTQRVLAAAQLERIQATINAVDLGGGQDALTRQYTSLSATINRLLHPDTDVVVSYAHPYERLSPSAVPTTNAVTEWEMVTLAGEYQAAGLVLASGSAAPLVCEVAISGLDARVFSFTVRRQEFVEEWYEKEKARVADPLPRLVREDGAWKVTLMGGGIAKLYVVCETTGNLSAFGPGDVKEARRFEGMLHVRIADGQAVEMPLRVLVLPVALPPVRMFPFHMFARTKRFMVDSPELAAKDLADHRVSMVERNVLPRATFSPEGDVLSIDFARHDALLKTYLTHLRRLFVFWHAYPFDRFRCDDGSYLKPQSDPWQKAYVKLLASWHEHVTGLGYGPERFVHHVIEELSSSSPQEAPDERVLFCRRMVELTRSAVPEATISATLCDYAFPEDVCVQAPLADIVLVGLPYRSKLPRNAPPTYNPRETLETVIWPFLEGLRRDRGVELWTYHCQSGKRGDVLRYYRTWPVVQAVDGRQGTSHWAYDDISGPSSWSDTDGGRMDFIFNYDGTEEHPINRRVNPTREPLVPSIRYEALRAGLQDAAVLKCLELALENGECPGELEEEIAALRGRAKAYGADPATHTHADAAAFSRRLRTAYASSVR